MAESIRIFNEKENDKITNLDNEVLARPYLDKAREDVVFSVERAAATYNIGPLKAALEKINELELPEKRKGVFTNCATIFDSFYHYMTNTKKALETKNSQKIKTTMDSITEKLNETQDAQDHVISLIDYIGKEMTDKNNDIYIAKKSREEFMQDANQRKKDLDGILIALDINSDKGLIPNLETMRDNYQYDYDNLISNVQLQDDLVDGYLQERENLLEEKKDQEANRRILHATKQFFISQIKQLDYSLKKESKPSIVKTLLESKLVTGNVYNLQNDLLDDSAQEINIYNDTAENLPTQNEMLSSYTSKRRSIPKIKR